MNASTTTFQATPTSMTKQVASTALRFGALTVAIAIGAAFAAPARAGIFDAPTAQEQAAERDRCYRSKFCRALVDDRPPAVMNAVNDEPLCALNANRAAQALAASGYEAKIVQVRLPEWRFGRSSSPNRDAQRLHAFAAARVDGQWWAIDNGALPSCGRACKLGDALAGVEKLGETAAITSLDDRSNVVSQNQP
jgi:hypothetical protein